MIRERLAGYEPLYVEDNGLARAAVLLPLYDTGGEPHVLFTVRSELVEHHKGQISFPGGGADASDPDLVYTARRETFEEIGVAMEHVEERPGPLEKVYGEADRRGESGLARDHIMGRPRRQDSTTMHVEDEDGGPPGPSGPRREA